MGSGFCMGQKRTPNSWAGNALADFRFDFSAGLSWGWLDVAGSLALLWGGIHRPGELLASRRSDLFLPGDTRDTNTFALRSPKQGHVTRAGIMFQVSSSYRMLWPVPGQIPTFKVQKSASSFEATYVW